MNPSIESTATAEAGRARAQLADLRKRLATAERRVAVLNRQLTDSQQEAQDAAVAAVLAGRESKPDKKSAAIESEIAQQQADVETLRRAIDLAQSRLTFIQQDEIREQAQSLLPEYVASVRRLHNALTETDSALLAHAEAVKVLKREGVVGGLGLNVLSTDELTRHHGQQWADAVRQFRASAVAAGYVEPEQQPCVAVVQRQEPSAEPGPDAPAEFHREYWDGQPIPAPAPKPVEWDEGFWKGTTETLVDAGKPND